MKRNTEVIKSIWQIDNYILTEESTSTKDILHLVSEVKSALYEIQTFINLVILKESHVINLLIEYLINEIEDLELCTFDSRGLDNAKGLNVSWNNSTWEWADMLRSYWKSFWPDWLKDNTQSEHKHLTEVVYGSCATEEASIENFNNVLNNLKHFQSKYKDLILKFVD